MHGQVQPCNCFGQCHDLPRAHVALRQEQLLGRKQTNGPDLHDDRLAKIFSVFTGVAAPEPACHQFLAADGECPLFYEVGCVQAGGNAAAVVAHDAAWPPWRPPLAYPLPLGGSGGPTLQQDHAWPGRWPLTLNQGRDES